MSLQSSVRENLHLLNKNGNLTINESLNSGVS